MKRLIALLLSILVTSLLFALNFDETLKIIEDELKLKITFSDDEEQVSTSTKSTKKGNRKKK